MDAELLLKSLPEKPGVYIFKDKRDKVIYVGKAVSLKNRVKSYFQASNKSPKVQAILNRMGDLDYIVTDSEMEALILECNLIKKHRPRYNVMLKDDKSYPYLRLTLNERFPRLIITRRVKDDGSRYFGPYTNVGAVRETLTIIKRLFPLRSCGKDLTDVPLKERPCLNHHIRRCLAPCSGKVDDKDYDAYVKQVLMFLMGRQEDLVKKLEQEMRDAAEHLEFERAAEIRDRISAVKKVVERQKIITSDAVDRDVIGMARGFNETNIHIFFVRQGKLIDRQAFILGGTDELSRPEIMSIFIKQFYTRAAYIPPEILTSDPVDEIELIESWLSGKRGMRVHLRTPQRGEKKALADMAAENALLAMEQKAKLIEARTDRALLATLRLAEALNMDVPINRVEAYDISNIQGKQSVASMVVFEEGKPAKDQYRHFRIKTVEGPDDFASMKEVIHRRFKRGLEEKKQCLQTGFARMPDLVVIDGGKGQLAAAVEAMTELGTNNIPTIGLAEKHEHIFKFGEPEPLVLPRDSEALLLLQQIRDEAHRFAVAYHRKLRGKAAIVSVLDGIPGIGKVRRKALLRAFGSVEEIRKASIDEIRDVPGMDSRAAQSVYDYFRRHTI